MNLSIFGKTESETLYHNFKNAFVVLCLTEEDTKYETLLWSHYADLHCGICIQFTPDYTNKKSPFYKLEQVKYKKSIPKVTSKKDPIIDGYVNNILKTKAFCWNYEKEWRSLLLNDKGDKVKKTNIHGFEIDCGRQHTFESKELTKVIFGCKINKSDERVVMNWIDELGNTNIRVEKAFVDETDYKLNFLQII